MGLVGLCGNLRLLATLVFSLYSVVQLALLVLNVLVVTSTSASVEAALNQLDQDAGLLGDAVLHNTAREIITRVRYIKKQEVQYNIFFRILVNTSRSQSRSTWCCWCQTCWGCGAASSPTTSSYFLGLHSTAPSLSFSFLSSFTSSSFSPTSGSRFFYSWSSRQSLSSPSLFGWSCYVSTQVSDGETSVVESARSVLTGEGTIKARTAVQMTQRGDYLLSHPPH